VKHLCTSLLEVGDEEVYSCERKAGHKGKHREKFRQGFGSKYVDIVVKCKEKK
jgi:hypothetical protein